jgi:hypothetical protein
MTNAMTTTIKGTIMAKVNMVKLMAQTVRPLQCLQQARQKAQSTAEVLLIWRVD